MNINFSKYSVWLFRLSLLSFFLPGQAQSILLILSLCLLSLPVISNIKLLSAKEILPLLFVLFVYILYVVAIPFTDSAHRSELFSLLERKIGLFLIPIAFLLISKSDSINPFKELIWFSCFCVLFLFSVNAYILLTNSFSTLNHVEYRNTFIDVSAMHPTYAGMYIGLSLCIMVFDLNSLKLWLSSLLQFVLIICLALLAPKISLLFVLLFYTYSILFYWNLTIKAKVLSSIGLVITLSLLFFSIPFFSQRIQEVIEHYHTFHFPMENNSMTIRELIFEVDINLLKEHWICGVGPGRLATEQENAFNYLSFVVGKPLGIYNTHNEYLNQWLSFGLVGFLYFISYWIFYLKKAFDTKNFLFVFFIIMLMLTCLTENILSRQQGVLLVAFFLNLFYFFNKKKME